MRNLLVLGLFSLAMAGCSREPAARDAVEAKDPAEANQASEDRPQEPARANEPPIAVQAGPPIPQDAARMEARSRDWLEWNRRTLRGSYDKVGKQDPGWDEQARGALEVAALTMSRHDLPAGSPGLHAAVKNAIDAGCDDPLILYLHARSSTDANFPELPEFDRRTRAAAEAMLASAYPALRRAFAQLALVEFEAREENPSPGRHDLGKKLDGILELLPKSVADDPRGEFWEARWYELINRAIGIQRQLSGDYKASFDRVDAGLADVKGIEALRLLVRGNFMFHWGWEARTTRFAPAVGEERFRTFEGRVAEARAALMKAWEVNPDEPRVAALLLDIEKSAGDGDREAMELWFGRAMKADGDDRDACWSKLDWLDPKWHGSAEDMLAFGRACRDTKNSRSGITLLVADAHWRIACMSGEGQNKYLASPEVWDDIRSVYDEYLKHHPEDDVARSKFATFSALGGHYREAEVQYVALGDRLAQWREFPNVPLVQLKQRRERNARVVLGKEGRIAPPGWHFVGAKDEDGEWTINVPAQAPHQQKPSILGSDTCHFFTCDANGITYGLRVTSIPPSFLKDGPERILEAARSAVAKERNARPGDVRDTLLAARHGQEYDVDGPKLMRVKAIVIGSWLYELSVTGSKKDLTGEAPREFFDSFAFQPKVK